MKIVNIDIKMFDETRVIRLYPPPNGYRVLEGDGLLEHQDAAIMAMKEGLFKLLKEDGYV